MERNQKESETYIILQWEITEEFVKELGLDSTCEGQSVGSSYCVQWKLYAFSLGWSFDPKSVESKNHVTWLQML